MAGFPAALGLCGGLVVLVRLRDSDRTRTPYAMGTVELVIQLKNPKPSGSGMAGLRSESLIIERRSTDEILGVHFKAGESERVP
jgi:phosphopantothenate synthetase